MKKKKKKKMEHHETAVASDKDIEELNRFNKYDQFITLSRYYHVNRCELEINCSKKCDFVLKNLMNNLKQYCTYGIPRISNYEYGQLQKIIIIIIKKKF